MYRRLKFQEFRNPKFFYSSNRQLFSLVSILLLISLAYAVDFQCSSRYRRHIVDPTLCTVSDLTLTKQNHDLRFTGSAQERGRIKSLYFHSSKFEVLPAQFFQIFSNLEHISVFRCDVNGRIDDNLLKDMGPITNVALRVNDISDVSEGAFKQLKDVHTISLSSNEITTLPENVFKYNTKLTNIDLDGNQITHLSPKTFKFNQQLRAINLRRNALRNIPENLFGSLRVLEDIYLSDNQLETIPASVFKNNPRLDCIDLDSNKIKMLSPDTFKNLNKLEKLYLSGNQCINQQYGFGRSIGRSGEDLTQCYSNWK